MNIIDTTIIGFYLFVTIIIGIVAGRDVKTTKEFAVGNKDFLTVTLIMTIFATYVDGEVILNGTTQSFKNGISFFLVNCGAWVGLFLYGFIALRVTKHREAISVGDIVGSMYGKNSQVLTGISGFLISTALVAAQFKALSFVFDYFYDLDTALGVWLSAGILIAYSAFGGVRAVTWTDAVQFFILINAVPLVTSVAVNRVGGLYELFNQMPTDKLQLVTPDREQFYKYIVYFIAVLLPLCSPPMIQRMLMSKDTQQTKRAYWISTAIGVPFIFIISIAGMAAYLHNPDMDSNNAFLYLIDRFMPIGLKGFAIAGIIAVIMSTADSFMNTAAISFSHDFLKTIYGNKMSDTKELFLTKIVTLLIGVLACFIAMSFDNLIDLMLYSFTLWGPVISVPLLLGLFDIKGPKYSFYASMFAGVGTAVIWDLLGLEQKYYIYSIIPALIANFVVFTSCLAFDRLTKRTMV